MWIWAVILVFGICTFLSFYMTFLAFSIGDGGSFLFLSFGMVFGVIFLASVIQVAAKKSAFLRRVDNKISGEPKSAVFVPHRFMMLTLIIAGIGMLAAILIPIFLK
jgi:hypothetical protein